MPTIPLLQGGGGPPNVYHGVITRAGGPFYMASVAEKLFSGNKFTRTVLFP